MADADPPSPAPPAPDSTDAAQAVTPIDAASLAPVDEPPAAPVVAAAAFDEIELDFLNSDLLNEIAPLAALPLAKNILDPIPPLREIRARVINMGEAAASSDNADQTAVLLEDPNGIAVQPAAISAWAYALALLFDGTRTAVDVAEAFKDKYSQAIQPEQVLVLQNELDSAMFLNSSSFENNAQDRLEKYLDMRAWPAAHAGTAYPSDPTELMASFIGYFSAPDGPGALGAPELELDLQPIDESETGGAATWGADSAVRGLIVPHIDLRVGGATYAHAYKEMMRPNGPELIFILGVAHQSLNERMFSVSQKDFETPLGTVTTNREIARRLHVASGSEDLLAELTHRGEHSIEFQAALIAALLAKRCRREIQIVPILCGSIEPCLARNADPFADPEFLRFTDALRDELNACGKKWCVLCSVDLSHVGPEFGHNSMIDERLLRPVERMDRKLLKLAEKLDVRGFYDEIARTQNSRHVDAVLAVMTMLISCRWLLQEGKLLHYDQMLKAPTHSAVSYAAMAFGAA